MHALKSQGRRRFRFKRPFLHIPVLYESTQKRIVGKVDRLKESLKGKLNEVLLLEPGKPRAMHVRTGFVFDCKACVTMRYFGNEIYNNSIQCVS